MLSGEHVFQGYFAVFYLVGSGYGYEWNVFGVGIGHLLFHFRCVGIEFCAYAGLTEGGDDGHDVACFVGSEVGEEYLGAAHAVVGI